jgi:hypothetical protein
VDERQEGAYLPGEEIVGVVSGCNLRKRKTKSVEMLRDALPLQRRCQMPCPPARRRI